jgi:hypothetical protein
MLHVLGKAGTLSDFNSLSFWVMCYAALSTRFGIMEYAMLLIRGNHQSLAL